MKVDNIDGSRLGYGRIYFGFSVDIPDEQYWRYSDTDKNYAILVEAILKFKEICEKQKESIENKKQIINNLYGSRNIPCTVDVSDNVYNYVTTGDARARAFKDFVTIWEDNGSPSISKTLSEYERSYNDKTNSENNSKTNETTAFTSGEISW
jgi:hypothetical protein